MANLSVKQSPLIQVPSFLSKAEFPMKVATATAKAGRAVVTFLAGVSGKVPSSIQTFSKGTQLLNGVAVVLSLPKTINQIHETFTTKHAVERMEKGWKAAITIAAAAFGFVNTVSGLKAAGWMNAERFTWTGKIAPFAFPLIVVGLFFTTRQFSETQEFYKEMKGKIKPITGASKQENIAEIVSGCEAIVANSKRIITQCKIGNVARIEEKAQSILNRIQNGDDVVNDGKKFIDAMRGRIRLTYGIELTGVVCSISSTVASALTANIPTPVTLGFAAVAYSASLTHLIVSEILYSKNPLSKINI